MHWVVSSEQFVLLLTCFICLFVCVFSFSFFLNLFLNNFFLICLVTSAWVLNASPNNLSFLSFHSLPAPTPHIHILLPSSPPKSFPNAGCFTQSPSSEHPLPNCPSPSQVLSPRSFILERLFLKKDNTVCHSTSNPSLGCPNLSSKSVSLTPPLLHLSHHGHNVSPEQL